MPDSLVDSGAWPPCLSDIDSLTARLRAVKVPVSLGDELRLRTLLERLADCGTPISNANDAARWLAPVLCRNDDHHKALVLTLDQLDVELRKSSIVSRLAPSAQAVPAETTREAEIETKTRRNRRQIIVSIAAAVLIVGLSTPFITGVENAIPLDNTAAPPPCTGPSCNQTAPPPAAPTQKTSLWRFSFVPIPIVLAATALMIRRRRRAFLIRGLVPRETPNLSRLLPATTAELLFRPDRIRTPAADWRRDRWEQSNRFDAVRSIESTVRAGGEPKIVNFRRRIVPEYILLVDRASAVDTMAAVADELADRLKAEQVNLTRFDYYGDPRQVVPLGPGGTPQRPRKLDDLLSDIGDTHQLVVVADAASAFQPRTRRPRAWLQALGKWRSPIWMSPAASNQQGTAENALRERGFEVTGISSDGVAAIGRLLRRESHAVRPETTVADESTLEAMLADQYRWTGDRPPADSEIASLIKELERSLGREALTLFAAVAVLPMADPRLTFYAAEQLATLQNWTMPLETLIAQVSRLPWLRKSYIPEWLRIAVVEWLELWDNRLLGKQIRTMWSKLLHQARHDKQGDQAAAPGTGDIRIKFAQTHIETIADQLDSKDLAAFEERILFAFLKGVPVRQVALEAPPGWQDFMPTSWKKTEAIVVGVGLVASAGFALWADALIALVPEIADAMFQNSVLPGFVAAIGLCPLVVVAMSYFRQFPAVDRIMENWIISLLALVPVLGVLCLASLMGARKWDLSLDYQAAIVLGAPALAYAILWLKSTTVIRLSDRSSVALLFDGYPVWLAFLVGSLVLSLAIGLTAAVQQAFLQTRPQTIVGFDGSVVSAAYVFLPVLLAGGLLASALRYFAVSTSRILLVGSGLLHIASILGSLTAVYLLYTLARPAENSSAICDAAMAVVLFAAVCAPLAVTRWRTAGRFDFRKVYLAAGLALAFELIKACVAYTMTAASADALKGYDWSVAMAASQIWFVPALTPAYFLATRLFGDSSFSVKALGTMLIPATPLIAITVIPYSGYSLFGQDRVVADLVIWAAPSVSLALEASSFILLLRQQQREQAAKWRSRPSADGASSLYAALLNFSRLAWPALLPATIILTAAIVIAPIEAGKIYRPSINQPPTLTSYIVFFDYDRSELSAQAQRTIDQSAAQFKALPNLRLTVTGHADGGENEDTNMGMALSLRRANATKDALVSRGIPAASITVRGVAGNQPLVKEAKGREPQNRFVEIVPSSSPAGSQQGPAPAAPAQTAPKK